MNSLTAIQEELKDLSSSLPFDKQPVFTVPPGYFENFAASVMARLKSQQQPADSAEELAELSPLLAAIPRKMPFTVPENYFSGLTQNLPSLLQEDQLPEVLQRHTRETPYTVPAGYFEGLAEGVLAQVQKPAGKVVSFGLRPWMRMAAAAVVTGLIAISTVLYFNSGSPGVDPNRQPEEWVAQKLKNISVTELEAFIRTADISNSGKELAKTSSKGAEVRKMLKDVSNSELEAFLNQVPIEDEAITIN